MKYHTESQQTLVQHLADLAKEVYKKDFFEFPAGLDKESTYNIAATSVLESYLNCEKDYKDETLLATCIHLLVENLVLNYQLMKGE